jgi:hypothetical protein
LHLQRLKIKNKNWADTLSAQFFYPVLFFSGEKNSHRIFGVIDNYDLDSSSRRTLIG